MCNAMDEFKSQSYVKTLLEVGDSFIWNRACDLSLLLLPHVHFIAYLVFVQVFTLWFIYTL